jgi:hypothetical protein
MGGDSYDMTRMDTPRSCKRPAQVRLASRHAKTQVDPQVIDGTMSRWLAGHLGWWQEKRANAEALMCLLRRALSRQARQALAASFGLMQRQKRAVAGSSEHWGPEGGAALEMAYRGSSTRQDQPEDAWIQQQLPDDSQTPIASGPRRRGWPRNAGSLDDGRVRPTLGLNCPRTAGKAGCSAPI